MTRKRKSPIAKSLANNAKSAMIVTRNLISCNSQGYKSVYKQDIDPVHLDQGYYSYNLKLLCNKSI